eukprot:gene11924-14083_t
MSLVSSFLGEALVAKETVISGPTMLFKKAAPKAAPKKGTKKAAPKGSSAGGKSVKGWGGGDAVYNLDKCYGYDPLGLGTDEEQVEAYRKTELLHARWAMLGVAGCVIPEACEALGSGNQISGSVWWQTGAAMLDGGLLKYFGTEIPLPLVVVVAAEVGLMGAVETYRNKNEGPAGEDLDPLYPGGKYFDPLGLADDPDAFAELKVKEIKNGRLAMMAMLGFAVQAGVTGDGPFANWAGHVNDPFGYNLLTVVGSAERVPTL